MPEVLDLSHSPSHFSSPASPPRSPSPTRVSSSSSSLCCPPLQNDGINHSVRDCDSPSYSVHEDGDSITTDCEEEEEEEESDRQRRDQLPVLALLLEILRKSLMACKSTDRRELCPMEIGCPTDVRHVAHVTFDSFHGFLGLPEEFEPEVPRRPPSASTTVFGVSTESMQLSFDSRGNSVPTILLLMQKKLYALGGLQAEGVFRIAAANSQEEYVRDQLNSGVVPEGIDVHCLAGLIKMADPLTALRYAVQVMNFLRTLILKTLVERKDSVVEPPSASHLEPSDENGHRSPSQARQEDITHEKEEREQRFITEEPISDISADSNKKNHLIDGEAGSSLTSSEKLNPDGDGFCGSLTQVDPSINKKEAGEASCVRAEVQGNSEKRETEKCGQQSAVPGTASAEKTRGISNMSHRFKDRAD
ncbi:hypothetical protein F2P56_011430 [Juglans regia]|uniref:CRIB domain-containing protein n=1 Tax=Juglans regia TaxID=51240 RepID=A0A834CZM6_JUGRE|nr:hypothetical protein F2P56_011430 [Juglans regia]